MMDLAAAGIAAAAAAFLAVHLATPPLARYLERSGSVVLDYHKRGRQMVARPGGPAIILGVLAAEAVVYGFTGSAAVLAVMGTSFLAFVVGLADDRMVLGGWFKPVALAGAAVPIILAGAYDTDLAFPLFGEVRIPLLYLAVIVVTISVTGNTINSIDVLNGVASGFMVISGLALTACLLILQNYEIALACVPMVCVSAAFYRFHRIPSRIFPGDSGALAMGAMYGSIAIVGGVEVVAAVALLPAVVNSFLFLSSTGRVVEHRRVGRPTSLTPDLKLRDSGDRRAPVTLVRLIVSGSPMSEAGVARAIFRLAAVSGAMAVVTALLMYVVV